MRNALCVSLAWSLFALLPAAATAAEEQLRDQVSFSVEADEDVENDRVEATLAVNAEDRDPAQLAETINRAMDWALQRARDEKGIDAQTAGYQTYPVYDERKIVRWRGRQELRLESQEVDRLSRLIGVLQERLQVQSLRFSVSPDRRRAVEEALVEQVLAGFQKRAALIVRSLGAKDYELVTVDIRTGERRPPIPVRAEAMATTARAAAAPPAMEAGTSRVNVEASGSIRLLRD
ncbi:MAG: SIMPL domain-containing protein [Gammaproteobacteria bacterium]|jgi:predicted secreted protein